MSQSLPVGHVASFARSLMFVLYPQPPPRLRLEQSQRSAAPRLPPLDLAGVLGRCLTANPTYNVHADEEHC